MANIRVVLADDHRIMREGLKRLIAAQLDMEVIGEADTGQDATVLVNRLKPDVVVMDISMPGLNGLAATERLAQLSPETKVVTLTRHNEDGYVQPLLAAGAKAYVLKQSASDELLRAIRAVAAGGGYLDSTVVRQMVRRPLHNERGGARASLGRDLSKREEEVLRLTARGMLTKEIAMQLKVSVKTVEAHKANALAKLGKKSRVDIVNYAILRNWLQQE